ncbi:DUF885 domain-containing protein [Rhodococcus sp. X156]|uniref:DUF885 domain-containing protein n=1 Tax=Rhodococcus sp. X156 TaxID=2499145 RepID=UPI000FD8E5C3|nr:DUF885 domain-containing protein [Rhodococcus sp. X156]
MADTPRQIADRYLDGVARLSPTVSTELGLPYGAGELDDFSPAGTAAQLQLVRATLDELADADATDPVEARCATLLRERLEAELAQIEHGEDLRAIRNLFSPMHSVREIFTMMPTETEADWEQVRLRLTAVPRSYAGYTESLREGVRQGLLAGPRQVSTAIDQLTAWLDSHYWAELVAPAPESMAAGLAAAADEATGACVALREFLRDTYAPVAAVEPDTVGPERYARCARYWTGSDVDLQEAYAWAWEEFARIDTDLRAEAQRVRAGATPAEAMALLASEGEAVEGVEQVRQRLQAMMDTAVAELDGTHFDLAEPVQKVEAMIAPAGGAAAPYYTPPSLDFSRPGRTWLPTMGQQRFPLWDLVSTWYHEGVPGHHLQLAQWILVAPQLSKYQTTLGMVSANAEGWALYAERLMDELGYLRTPGERIGYLDAQQMRAVRVIIDIGMHCQLSIPDDADFHPGEQWTPELGREFFGLHCGRSAEFADSELIRYLGMPGQAISYKLGERAWLRGRELARAEQGDSFDLKRWHMAALSMGSLGLDDLVDALRTAGAPA